MAWFFIAQLKKELDINLDMKMFLDLLSIAIIADVMPLKNINRVLVQAGLNYFQISNRPSIKFLRKTLKKDSFNSQDIGFTIAPILNSAGRMDSATLALDFLTSKDFFESSILYARLLSLNSKRKSEEKRVFDEAKLQNRDDFGVIVAAGQDWHEGVVGIVASRLADRFKKPAIVLTKSKECYKGSGRSYANIDLFSLLEKNKDILDRFGGHKKAAGLSLKESNLSILMDRLSSDIKGVSKEDWIEDENILGELPFSEIDWELLKILDMFAPYGEGNPFPKFVAFNIEIVSFKEVGENKDHLLMTLREKDRFFKAIKFKSSFKLDKKNVDIIYYPQKNRFKNSSYIQLNILNIN
ncbi:MAG TPA: hypothetical protein EYP79_02220 [Campylobacterales bacterium]|nr:hypothetical protein [Campylobacterales bacterium]